MDIVITATIGLPGIIVWSIVVLYLSYVVAMYFQRLEQDRDLRLHEEALRFVTGWFTVILSAAFNLTFAWLLFWERPDGIETFSARMSRYAYDRRYAWDWRREVARWLEQHVFDPHDPGHLKP